MAASGNLPKGTRVDALMRDLLGRPPGTVPGQDDGRERYLSPDASVEYLAAWVRAAGGKDARPGVTEGAGG